MPKAYASEPPTPHRSSRLCRNSASRAIFSTHSCPRMNCAHGTPTHGATSPASARHGSDRACGLREGARAGARAKAGMGMWLTCGCEGRRTREGRHGHVAHVRVRRPVHARRPAGTCRRGRRGGRAQTNEPSRALEPMRAFKPARYASGGCQTATVAHQRPRFKTAPTTSRAAPNRTSTASTSNVNEKPARKSSGRPST